LGFEEAQAWLPENIVILSAGTNLTISNGTGGQEKDFAHPTIKAV
jgi:hypothetical protein